jgi:hypothetical protein
MTGAPVQVLSFLFPRQRSAMTIRRHVVLILLVVGSMLNHRTVAAQTRDFNFRFEYGACLTERLDTFSGDFTRNRGGSPPLMDKVKLALTDVQMSAIYRTIEDIRFVDYPAVFVGVSPDAKMITETGPSSTYRFEVRNAGVVHAIVWHDSRKPTTAEADRLRELFSMIRGFIHDHPAFKRLPPALGGCE